MKLQRLSFFEEGYLVFPFYPRGKTEVLEFVKNRTVHISKIAKMREACLQ
jgi:hypothetical protein